MKNFEANVLENIYEGVCVVDKKGRVIYLNKSAERITGFCLNAVREHKCKDVFKGSICKKDCPLKTVIRTGQPTYHHKKDILTAKKQKITINSYISLLRDCNGKGAGIIEVFRDATELVKLEKEMIYSERLAAVGKLAAGIAHEINNPLSGISAAIEIVLKKIENRSPNLEDLKIVTEYLKSVEGEVIRCGNITRNFLNFSREVGFEKTPTNINKVLKDIIFLIEPQAFILKVNIEKKLDPNLPNITVDNIQLRQVFVNIILNSLDAMQSGGKLMICSKFVKTKSSFVVEITDTGCGISEEKLPHLFDLFYTSKEAGKGTGLGLPVSCEIIKRHNGSIDVRSEVGKGTSFTITLPL
ncbi:MAG: ATP-binding protein [bacterium]|nr:ATP-binding protein [bacterium]